ncbi:MAG: hypothetical protein F6J97_19235 [Leptolyngbya sp. SIO4C1]|nr:hypothetical protein [Leptolyngbya sp. SIO4C1]
MRNQVSTALEAVDKRWSIKLMLGLSTAVLLTGFLDLKPATALPDLAETEALPTQPRLLEPLQTEAPEAFIQEDYLLGVGDYLRVDVFNIPDYSGEFRVLSGGVLNLPVAGPVAVEGLSIQQAATQVEQQLMQYVRRPYVTLSVLKTRPLQIAIAGEVNRPGTYRLGIDDDADATSPELPTLTQVIELAGGITQSADIRQIQVQRRLPPGNLSALRGQRSSQTVAINLWDLLQAGDLEEDLRLQDGDRILIPTATALNPDEIAELATASFSPDQISVNVVGEVEAPGSIVVPPNTPLNQAILAAGGFNNRARRGTVNLVRLNPNGTVSQRAIEIDFTQGINDEMNPPLRPNDTVIVQRSGLARISDTVGTVLSPVRDAFGILRLFGL